MQHLFITFKCDFVLWKIKNDSLAEYQNTAYTSKISKTFKVAQKLFTFRFSFYHIFESAPVYLPIHLFIL